MNNTLRISLDLDLRVIRSYYEKAKGDDIVEVFYTGVRLGATPYVISKKGSSYIAIHEYQRTFICKGNNLYDVLIHCFGWCMDLVGAEIHAEDFNNLGNLIDYECAVEGD